MVGTRKNPGRSGCIYVGDKVSLVDFFNTKRWTMARVALEEKTKEIVWDPGDGLHFEI